MQVTTLLEKTLTKIGKNNSPIIAVIGIAVAKGIFRPTITMMDKKEDIQTKKYTAIREGLTELIAIPVYWISGKGSEKLASVLAKPEFFMERDLRNQYKNGVRNENINSAYAYAKKLTQENLPKMKTNMTFIGVCAAALFFIPAVCSLTIKPLMSCLNINKTTEEKTPIKQNINSLIYKPNNSFKKFNSIYDFNRRIGRI